MEKNKTGKYFKYAIGEIVLVVIGILIALSINNWNERKKESIQEVKILKHLKIDLVANLEELEGYHSFRLLQKNAIDSAFVSFKEQRPSDNQFRVNFYYILSGTIFNNANTTYKNIQSSSKQTISNDTLRAAITKMYETGFKNIPIRNDYINKIKIDQLMIYMNKHFKSHLISVNKGIQKIASLVEPIDIAKLRVDTEFENMLRRLYFHHEIGVEGENITINDLNKLILNLQEEINRLEQ
ncbi:MAG: hypothetical protein ACJA1B_000055 [Polaribacter sp.]|jgi:hypothetical protein